MSRALRWVAALLVAPLVAAAAAEPAARADTEDTDQQEAPAPKRPVPEWYGYVKLDAAWDEAPVEPGNFARWVASPSRVREHQHFNLTARQTRIGMRITDPGGEGPRLSGRVEIDFYGGESENKNQPQMRHAYAELAWPESGWTLLAGQTSDLISPLAPATLNYTVAWWAGNIGYRRPQLRVTRRVELGEARALELAAGVSRTIGDAFTTVDPGDSGADSGRPAVQARAGWSWPGGAVGLSGHAGRERLTEELDDPLLEADSWSLNLDLVLRLGARWRLSAEAWSGENLDDYFGGIAQGVNFTRGRPIDAHGGWLALAFTPPGGPELGLGAGLDDPDDADLEPGARARNAALWANAVWELRPAMKVGAELSYWRTDYLGLERGASLRVQSSLVYSF